MTAWRSACAELRYQVSDAPSPNRHQEALRSVKRAVDRFSDRDEVPVYRVNPQEVLQSAIHEIRSRQGAAPAAQSAAPPQLDRIMQSVSGLAGRLERLEGELRAQRDGGDVKAIGEQVAQLTHVVELLAGAVGETGQVKRLESQISGLASIISEGKNADVSTLTERLEALAATVERLANAQEDDHAALGQQASFSAGMASIEDNVRNIYDRIDAIEKNVALAPADFNTLTEEMAAFTEEMRAASSQAKPTQLLARVDALNARLADIEGKDGLVGGLKADVDALRTAIVDAFEPRFIAIETKLVAITDKLSAPKKADPHIGQIEAQIKQLVARMDETSVQLAAMAKLYEQSEAREAAPAPDFEALASLVAKRTSDAFAKAAKPVAAPNNGLSDETFAELEKRMTRLFEAASKDKKPDDFSGMQDGIRRVDERLDRLEAALSGSKLVEDKPVVADKPFAAEMPVRIPSAPAADAMPMSPAIDAPLVDKRFADNGPVRAALEAKTGVSDASRSMAKMREVVIGEPEAKLPIAGMRPVTPEMVGGKSAKPALETSAPAVEPEMPAQVLGMDPTTIPRPPRPQSSLDAATSRDAFAFTPPEHAAPAVDGPGMPSAVARSTFIEAARRAQRQAPAKAEPNGNSLMARAMGRFQANAEAAAQAPEARAEAAPGVETVQKPKKVKKEKPAKAEKAVVADGEVKQGNFLTRYRQPILLAATIVAIGFLSLNLINQRNAAQAPEAEVTEEAPAAAVAPTADPATMDAVEPAPEVPAKTSALETKPATTIRAIPGTGAEEAIDTMAVGSINPNAAMNFSKEAEIAALPSSALQLAATSPVQQPLPAIATASPVKVELPPEAIGPVEMRQAAADGDARAQFEVAAIFTEGRAVEQDYAQALTWYERSAAQGFAPAQYRLGSLYEAGKGTEKNLEQARLWYQRAAEAGNRMSMHNLAALYAGGGLGKQEFESAAQWFEQAANRGMTDSQYNLGMLYARGLGVTQNMETSFKWFSLAAGSGDKDAATARDDIAKSLDAGAVARISAEVATWTAQPIDLAANFAPIGTWSKTFNAGEAISNKEVISKVQTALMRLGYDVGKPDGVTGPKTAVAIKAFEKATGMSETGVINPRLLAVLGSQPV
jgi:localization factor PodJL